MLVTRRAQRHRLLLERLYASRHVGTLHGREEKTGAHLCRSALSGAGTQTRHVACPLLRLNGHSCTFWGPRCNATQTYTFKLIEHPH